MSDEAKLAISFLLLVAILIGVGVIMDGQRDANQRAKCHAALEGSTASDSLRIIRVQPKCAP